MLDEILSGKAIIRINNHWNTKNRLYSINDYWWKTAGCEYVAKNKVSTKELAEKWFSGTRPTEFEDYKSLTGENGTIHVGMTDTDPPFSYQDDDVLTGFDLEYIILFAREYGYKLELNTVDFSFILGSVQTGKYDLALGGITITDERKEMLNFTDSHYQSSVIMVTKGNDSGQTSLSDLSDKRLAIVTGSIFSITLPPLLPDATYLEFNNYSDVISALENGISISDDRYLPLIYPNGETIFNYIIEKNIIYGILLYKLYQKGNRKE